MENDRSRISRREFIRRGVRAAGLVTAIGLGGVGLIKHTQIQELAGGVADAYDLWQLPDETFRRSYLLDANIQYSASETSDINIVAFGDSNMGGTEGQKGAVSAIKLFAIKAQEKLGLRSRDYNLAEKGATTKKVIEDQILSPRARRIFENPGLADVWINAGGNNLGEVLKNKDDIDEMGEQMTVSKAILKYGPRIVDSLSQLDEDYSSLLEALSSQYGDKIRNLVIMSVPDISKAHGITSPKIENDEAPTFSLDSQPLQRLAYNIAVRINNSMFRAAERFQEAHPEIRVICINTFPESDFNHDQHLTTRAFLAIADEAVQRTRITS